jgi:hypothetical protein
MSRGASPLRFLGLVLGGWIAVRALLVAPGWGGDAPVVAAVTVPVALLLRNPRRRSRPLPSSSRPSGTPAALQQAQRLRRCWLSDLCPDNERWSSARPSRLPHLDRYRLGRQRWPEPLPLKSRKLAIRSKPLCALPLP